MDIVKKKGIIEEAKEGLMMSALEEFSPLIEKAIPMIGKFIDPAIKSISDMLGDDFIGVVRKGEDGKLLFLIIENSKIDSFVLKKDAVKDCYDVSYVVKEKLNSYITK